MVLLQIFFPFQKNSLFAGKKGTPPKKTTTTTTTTNQNLESKSQDLRCITKRGSIAFSAIVLKPLKW